MYLFRQEDYSQVSGFIPSSHRCHPSEREKKEMALAAIGGEHIHQIAKRFGVSRKCVYAQMHRALKAIDDEFKEKPHDQEKALFTVSFNNGLVRKLVLAMFLCGKSSYRAIERIFEDVFQYHISLGKLSAIIADASRAAVKINASYDLSEISVACHDDFFHDNHPYVVAIEPMSRFCFLLETSSKPLDELWANALTRLVNLGYAPNYVTADGGVTLKSALCPIAYHLTLPVASI
ncbi:MAG: helix-turn-helix domain-containing protein [Oligoflexales bacterium]|nr:helix-turn-helix domain-containing protein [Oligoflexales bacterium]